MEDAKDIVHISEFRNLPVGGEEFSIHRSLDMHHEESSEGGGDDDGELIPDNLDKLIFVDDGDEDDGADEDASSSPTTSLTAVAPTSTPGASSSATTIPSTSVGALPGAVADIGENNYDVTLQSQTATLEKRQQNRAMAHFLTDKTPQITFLK